jgi:hypothetical protein
MHPMKGWLSAVVCVLGLLTPIETSHAQAGALPTQSNAPIVLDCSSQDISQTLTIDLPRQTITKTFQVMFGGNPRHTDVYAASIKDRDIQFSTGTGWTFTLNRYSLELMTQNPDGTSHSVRCHRLEKQL